jgi:dTDP-4-amino-4,6-dideoxygalactose transaminase
MQRRENNAHYLDERLREIPGIKPLLVHPNVTRQARHLYIFRYEAEAFDGLPRERFIEALRAEGVPCHKGYTPLYREQLFVLDPRAYPWIEGINYRELHLPVTERAGNEEAVWITQPALLGAEKDVEDIVKAVAKVQQHVDELLAKRE